LHADTNIDYLTYTQQATLFLSPNNERTYSKLVGDTGPLVYPALHLYIYSFLHKMFPRASLIGVAGFVPGTNSTLDALEEGLSEGSTGGPGELLPLQLVWLGVYTATLLLIAVIAGQAYGFIQSYRESSARWPTSPTAIVTRLITGPTPLPLLLGALSLSLRLHSIYVLRLFNDPITMVLLYLSVWLFTKKSWKVGSIVYS
jgi:alpha-1,3-mannosyltransferase